MRKEFYYILLIAVTFANSTYTQTLPLVTNNMGGLVYVNYDAVVQVNGTFHNQGTQSDQSRLLNRGNLYIEGDFRNDGYAEGDYYQAGPLSGYGYMEVFKNWINNSIFNPGYGTVVLNGSALQWIKGDSASHFHNLILDGTGFLKKMGRNASVKNILYLNDKELATDSFTMYILNINPSAIERTTGFVSSLPNGWLAREVRVKSNYIYPVGSSQGPLRYRPVGIKPVTTPTATNTYRVRFVNNNPAIDSYDVDEKDDEICKVHHRWYHMLSKIKGLDTSNIRIYYDPATDNEWNTIVHWDYGDVGHNVWNPTGDNAETTPDVPTYKGLTTVWGYDDFKPQPFALGYKFPVISDLNCPQKLCDDGLPHPYSVENGNPSGYYVWTFDTATITGYANGQSVDAIWEEDPSATGHVSVYMLYGPYQCWSNVLECDVSILPNPTAAFTTDSLTASTGDYIHFINQSTGANTYSWDFGDGTNSIKESPYHSFTETNQFNVMLIAYSEDGCVDTAYKSIEIKEYFIIPNVFTPNGDGINDFFMLNTSGLTEFNLLIYNRWGELLFETHSPYVGWDGKTASGTEVPAGTYYYIAKGKSAKSDYNQNGYFSLVR